MNRKRGLRQIASLRQQNFMYVCSVSAVSVSCQGSYLTSQQVWCVIPMHYKEGLRTTYKIPTFIDRVCTKMIENFVLIYIGYYKDTSTLIVVFRNEM